MSGLGMLHFDFSHRRLIQIALDDFLHSLRASFVTTFFPFIENVNIFGNLFPSRVGGLRDAIDCAIDGEKRFEWLVEKLKHIFRSPSSKVALRTNLFLLFQLSTKDQKQFRKTAERIKYMSMPICLFSLAPFSPIWLEKHIPALRKSFKDVCFLYSLLRGLFAPFVRHGV